jgi:hypothetical protein
MLYSRLSTWLKKLFVRQTHEMPEALVIREYVLTGWDFATAISEVTVCEKKDRFTLLRAWEIAEKRYSDRGFRAIPLDDFVKHATLNVPLRGLGVRREFDEMVILHAPYYRVYEWKKPSHHFDLFTMLRDEGHLAEDYSRVYARQMKQNG